MVLTSRVHTTFFAPTASSARLETLVRLPLSVAPQYEARCQLTGEIVALPHKPLYRANLWTSDEHERFLQGLELFPNGPWKEVAAIVGTKTTRQTMTHAQKYRQKIQRRMKPKPVKAKKATTNPPRDCDAKREAPSVDFHASYYAPLEPISPPAGCTCSHVHRAPSTTISSPVEPWNDVFDTSFLDQEFQFLLSSLEPLPAQTQQPMYPTHMMEALKL